MWCRSTGHSPVKGNCPSLSYGCEWGIMTLVVDMRPIATPHIGVWCYGNCKYHGYVSFNLHRHSSGCPPRKPMMQSYYSIDQLEDVCMLCRQCSRLPNHMIVRCPSWSYDPIYDMLRVWPDSYQEHNTLILHRHEHDNHWDLWQNLQGTFVWM